MPPAAPWLAVPDGRTEALGARARLDGVLHPLRRILVPAVAALVATTALAGCRTEVAPIVDDGTTVAVLLADDAGARLRVRGVPALEQRLARACPECGLVVEVAGGDAALQADQLDAALEEGADAVVLQATSAEAGDALVEEAGEVPVVAYDRPLPGADHAVAVDGAALGRVQAEAALTALGSGARGARVLALDAAPGGAAEQARRQALEKSLGAAGARVVAGEATAVSAAEARAATAARLRRGDVDAVVAASDVQAEGALAALGGRRSGVVVVGAGADLAAVRRLLTGAQEATVWADERAMAGRAADVAAALALGEPVPQAEGTTRVAGMPTDLVTPRPVTVGEVARLLVRRDVVSIAEVCDARTRTACQRAGLL